MQAGIGGLDLIKARMRWLEARQAVLSSNVANADTPGFMPSDVAPMAGKGMALGPLRTDARHLGAGGGSDAGRIAAGRFETRPRGGAVVLEDEMLKVAETQIEHQTLAGLYQRSLAMLKTAIGRKG